MRTNYLWWIAGTLAGFLFIGAVLYISFYNILEGERTAGTASSIDILESEVGEVEVKDRYSFNGAFPVHILYASNSDQSMIYYINKDEGTVVDRISQKEEMKKETIRKAWENNCSQCTFTHIQPAYKNNHPLWEITFTDSQGRYGLAYYHATTGEEYQRFAFKKMDREGNFYGTGTTSTGAYAFEYPGNHCESEGTEAGRA